VSVDDAVVTVWWRPGWTMLDAVWTLLSSIHAQKKSSELDILTHLAPVSVCYINSLFWLTVCWLLFVSFSMWFSGKCYYVMFVSWHGPSVCPSVCLSVAHAQRVNVYAPPNHSETSTVLISILEKFQVVLYDHASGVFWWMSCLFSKMIQDTAIVTMRSSKWCHFQWR